MARQDWIDQARQHWKDVRPSVFQGLSESGSLESHLRYAAEQTEIEMASLTKAGLMEQEAWEIVRERYLFPPEEGATPRD